jgi:hypothetical protein
VQCEPRSGGGCHNDNDFNESKKTQRDTLYEGHCGVSVKKEERVQHFEISAV